MKENIIQMPLRIPKSLHEDIKLAAAAEGVSLNQYCLYLLSKHVVDSKSYMQKKGEDLFFFLEEAHQLQKELNPHYMDIEPEPPVETPIQRWRKLYEKD